MVAVRHAAGALLAPAAGHFAMAFAAVQASPRKAIRFVRPFPPGGGTDIFGRARVGLSLREARAARFAR